MSAGNNTLDTIICQLLINSITENSGVFSSPLFLENYVKFMTTPDTHNDVYAASAHRMFFANYIKKLPLDKCSDQDGKQIDSACGLINVIPVAVRAALVGKGPVSTSEVINCTRKSKKLPCYGDLFAVLLGDLIRGMDLREATAKAALELGLDLDRADTEEDPLTPCYIDKSFPAMLKFAHKYADDPKKALLAAANSGGENTNRNALLGAVVGAAHGFDGLDKSLVTGLTSHDQIQKDVDAFLNSIA